MTPKKHLLDLDRLPNASLNRSDYLRLDKNENVIGFPESVLQDIRRMLSNNLISFYPDVTPLYEELAKYLSVKPNQIYLAAGSDGVIKSVFEVFVEPGDEVLTLEPTYAMYSVYAKMFQVEFRRIPYTAELDLPISQVISRLSSKTKLVCLANPNSPTGTAFSIEDLGKLLEVASRHSTLVLVDEAYYEYFGQTALGFLNHYDNLIMTRTFSKALGLASARLGYAVSSKSIIHSLFKVRPMYEVNQFAVCLGIYLLRNPELVLTHTETIKESRKRVQNEIRAMGLASPETHTNFILIHLGDRKTALTVTTQLQKEGILVRGGFPEPCLAPYIRVTLGSEGQMKQFLSKFSTLCASISCRGLSTKNWTSSLTLA